MAQPADHRDSAAGRHRGADRLQQARCRRGGALHTAGVKGEGDSLPDTTRFANELADADSGVIVFASATGKQTSVEKPEWENGAFTEALLEALSGRADYTHDFFLFISELETYLAERVSELTDNRQKMEIARTGAGARLSRSQRTPWGASRNAETPAARCQPALTVPRPYIPAERASALGALGFSGFAVWRAEKGTIADITRPCHTSPPFHVCHLTEVSVAMRSPQIVVTLGQRDDAVQMVG